MAQLIPSPTRHYSRDADFPGVISLNAVSGQSQHRGLLGQMDSQADLWNR